MAREVSPIIQSSSYPGPAKHRSQIEGHVPKINSTPIPSVYYYFYAYLGKVWVHSCLGGELVWSGAVTIIVCLFLQHPPLTFRSDGLIVWVVELRGRGMDGWGGY